MGNTSNRAGFYKNLATLLAALGGAFGCGGDDSSPGEAPDGGTVDGSGIGADAACPEGQVRNGGTCVGTVRCEMLDCVTQGKICEGEPIAACTKCDSNRGFIPDGKGGCKVSEGSCQSQADCKEGEYCLKLDTSASRPPTCTPAPSCFRASPSMDGPPRAWDAVKQDCVDCASCQGVTGSTGRLWPVTSSGACVCETTPGYYFDASVSARRPRACDADGDGWVEIPARDAVYNVDVALRSNAHCTVRKVSAFTLRNERGEERSIALGELGLSTPSLDLFEPRALDAQTEFDAVSARTPTYGTRRFQSKELNPLTKACVDPRADFNQNGLFDIEERQAQSTSGSDAWMAPFVKLAYFVELDEGYFVPGVSADQAGTYLIAEKRRCEPARFLFDYGASTESAYWRNCERRRATDFSPANVWSDFGRYTCDRASGSCPPPLPGTLFDLTDLDPVTRVPRHQSCSSKKSPTFSGMNHGSQFRCVQFQDNVSTPYGVDLAQTWQTGETQPSPFVANTCGISGATSSLIPNGRDAVEAPLACKPTARSDLRAGQVGWALATFDSYDAPGDYVRGCISEGAEWPQLCPGQASIGTRSLGNDYDFGNLYCGCGREFGGSSCELGCAPGVASNTHTHTGGKLDPSWTQTDRALFACDTAGYCTNVVCKPGDAACKPGRIGYWMCGSVAVTQGIVAPWTSATGNWSLLSAEVPVSPFDRSKPLCDPASPSCTGGYRLW